MNHNLPPSRFAASPEQVSRNAAGIARCREVIDRILGKRIEEADQELTPSEEIHLAALKRAAAERRERRLVGVEHFSASFDRIRA